MDSAVRKRVLHKLTYGLYVLTTRLDGDVAAGTINFLTQTSFDPPLVVAGLRAGSRIAAGAEQSGAFAVNIVGKGQEETASAFFKGAKTEGDKVNGIEFTEGENGCAIFPHVPASFECKVLQVVKSGDHHIYVGRVTTVHENNDLRALTMADTDWSYGG